MLAPDETAGCPGCSFCADHVDGAFRHLAHHDVGFVAVSRAPLETIEAYRRRMGWDFQMGVVRRQRFQLRFPGVVHQG